MILFKAKYIIQGELELLWSVFDVGVHYHWRSTPTQGLKRATVSSWDPCCYVLLCQFGHAYEEIFLFPCLSTLGPPQTSLRSWCEWKRSAWTPGGIPHPTEDFMTSWVSEQNFFSFSGSTSSLQLQHISYVCSLPKSSKGKIKLSSLNTLDTSSFSLK